MVDMQSGSLDQAAHVVRRLKTDPGSVCPDELLESLRILPGHYFETQREVYIKGVRGAPDWLEYESLIWELSELVRSWLKAKRIPRGKNIVLDAVAKTVLDRRLGKGRQNFVLILAEWGGPYYGEIIGQILDDPAVWGHAVKALLKCRMPGHASAVSRVLSQDKTSWIRSAAKKYLAMTQA